MKSKYFNKVEEKYVFNISLIFWHIIIAIGALAIIAGALLLIWGVIPPFKQRVHRPEYPPVAAVSVDEVNMIINPPKPSTQTGEVKKANTPIKKITKEPAPGETEYMASLDSLKKLIPPDKFSWKSKGHWEYPYGRNYWEYYKKSRYRRWVVTRFGINDRLKAAYKRVQAEGFTEKKQLLDAYISTVSLFPAENRSKVLNALCTYSKETVPQSIANVKLLTQAIPNFTTGDVSYLDKLATFGKKNPRDGYAFIEYTNKTIGKFDSTARNGILDLLIESYYKNFKVIGKQIEATDLFLPMIAHFDSTQQTTALKQYYKIYLAKNIERERRIEQINYQYQSKIQEAESKYQYKKRQKFELRKRGFYGAGAGIVLIALIALILVSLSVQRNVKDIAEKLAQKK